MPPGGFRLAIVNSWNRETAFAVREHLALLFQSSLPLSRQVPNFENRVQDLVEL